MRVVFAVPIHQRIANARRDAALENRAIEVIVLTREEMDELAAWCESMMRWAPDGRDWLTRPRGERVTGFMGIRIQEELSSDEFRPGGVRFTNKKPWMA